MANSITASNSSAPFNGYLLTDASLNVTGTFVAGVATPSSPINFKVATPWPSIAQTEINISCTAPTGGTTNNALTQSYLTLQESADNSTWANVAYLAAPLMTVAGGTAANVTIGLLPTAKQYLRLSGSNATASVATAATYSLALLF